MTPFPNISPEIDQYSIERVSAYATKLIWIYPLLVAVAEVATISVGPHVGLLFHLVLLLALVLHRTVSRNEAEQNLLLALLLAPLTRILVLALPLERFSQMAWYGIIGVPLLICSGMVIRRLRLSRKELGLQPGDLLPQLMVAAGGLALGAGTYTLIQPILPASDPGLRTLWLPAVALLLCSGFTEELIFRGVLQAATLPALGRLSVVFASLVFVAVQISTFSPAYLLLVASIGLAFGYIVFWGGSLLGVSLAHGLANVMLLLVMPYLAENPSPEITRVAPWLLAGSVLLALLGALLVWRRSGAVLPQPVHVPEPLPAAQPLAQATSASSPFVVEQPVIVQPAVAYSAPISQTRPLRSEAFRRATATRVAVQPAGSAPALMRALRLRKGLTYVELARRSGIQVRQLAEMEYGLRPLLPEYLDHLARGLGVSPRELTFA